MSTKTIQQTEGVVYPGEFIPFYNLEDIKTKFNKSSSLKIKKPMVNIIESQNIMKIEMAIPGFKREDFCIETEENILSVCVMDNTLSTRVQDEYQLHEFDCERYERHIVLPKNADVDFVSATYNEGILKLLIPKIKNSENKKHTRIVVY